MTNFSIIIPVFNEEGNILPLYEKLKPIIKKIDPEIIFINDGSTDSTELEIKKLPDVYQINLRRNFGQTAALKAGFDHAKGDIIITLDGDGQNDPADIPSLIKKINQGYDVVSGWRVNRHDPLSKRIISRVADKLRKIILHDNIHDSGCTLKAYRKECFRDLDLYGEMHRFIPAILSWKGFKITEIPVQHHPRIRGVTKYKISRTFKGLIDMFNIWFWYRYSSRPLHLFGGIGLFLIFLGIITLTLLAILKIFFNVTLSEKIWPLVGFFSLIAGLQLFVSGILADIAIKTYYNSPKHKTYSIKN